MWWIEYGKSKTMALFSFTISIRSNILHKSDFLDCSCLYREVTAKIVNPSPVYYYLCTPMTNKAQEPIYVRGRVEQHILEHAWIHWIRVKGSNRICFLSSWKARTIFVLPDESGKQLILNIYFLASFTHKYLNLRLKVSKRCFCLSRWKART